jgi:hypothetical protein
MRRDLDRWCAVFGAQRHRYELKLTVSEREVVSFEKKIKIALPPGLREDQAIPAGNSSHTFTIAPLYQMVTPHFWAK